MAFVNGSLATYKLPAPLTTLSSAISDLEGIAFSGTGSTTSASVFDAAKANSLTYKSDDGSTLSYSNRFSATSGYSTSEAFNSNDVSNGFKIVANFSVDASNKLINSSVITATQKKDPTYKNDDVKISLSDKTDKAGVGTYSYTVTTANGKDAKDGFIVQSYDTTTSKDGMVTVNSLVYSQKGGSVSLKGSVNSLGADNILVAGTIENAVYKAEISKPFTFPVATGETVTSVSILANSAFTEPAADATSTANITLPVFTDLVESSVKNADKKITISGTKGVDSVSDVVGSGKDTIVGSSKSDLDINGMGGDDVISLGDGNDSVTVGVGDGNDDIDGGAGSSDELILTGSGWVIAKTATGYSASIAGTTGTPDSTDADGNIIEGTVGTKAQVVTFKNIETVQTTSADGIPKSESPDSSTKSKVQGEALIGVVFGRVAEVGQGSVRDSAAMADTLGVLAEIDWTGGSVTNMNSPGSNSLSMTSGDGGTAKYQSKSTGLDASGGTVRSESIDVTTADGDKVFASYSGSDARKLIKVNGEDEQASLSRNWQSKVTTSNVTGNKESHDVKYTLSTASVFDVITGFTGAVNVNENNSGKESSSAIHTVTNDFGSVTSSATVNSTFSSDISAKLSSVKTDSVLNYSANSKDKSVGVTFKISGSGTDTDADGVSDVGSMAWSGVGLTGLGLNSNINLSTTSFNTKYYLLDVNPEGEGLADLIAATESDVTAEEITALQNIVLVEVLKGNNIFTVTNSDDAIISAGGGDDIVKGAGGNDNIAGGKGVNTLTGGAGKDTFVFSRSDYVGAQKENNVTTITDFDADTFNLVGFNKVSNKMSFKTLADAKGSTSDLIYEQSTKTLWFDQDGQSISDKDPVKIATFVGTAIDQFDWSTI